MVCLVVGEVICCWRSVSTVVAAPNLAFLQSVIASSWSGLKYGGIHHLNNAKQGCE